MSFLCPLISSNEVSPSPVSSFKIQGQGHPTWQKKKKKMSSCPTPYSINTFMSIWTGCLQIEMPFSRLGNLTPPHWLSLKVSWLPPRSTPPGISLPIYSQISFTTLSTWKQWLCFPLCPQPPAQHLTHVWWLLKECLMGRREKVRSSNQQRELVLLLLRVCHGFQLSPYKPF